MVNFRNSNKKQRANGMDLWKYKKISKRFWVMSWAVTFRERTRGRISHSTTAKAHPRRLSRSPQRAMEGQDASPILYVNGKRHVMPQGKAEQTLLAYLRGAFLPNLSRYTSSQH